VCIFSSKMQICVNCCYILLSPSEVAEAKCNTLDITEHISCAAFTYMKYVINVCKHGCASAVAMLVQYSTDRICYGSIATSKI